MAADPLLLLQADDDDDAYNSASDEEFDPAAATAGASDDDDALSSSSDEDADDAADKPRTQKTKKRKRAAAADDDAELDSGDEATIAATKKQRQDFDGDNEGGEGGLVKTRAQRRLEQKERRPLARVDGATADVDAIWAALSAAPVGEAGRMTEDKEAGYGGDAGEGEQQQQQKKKKKQVAAVEEQPDEEMITIKRTYDFAGDRITEERQVPKSSAEARLYLAQQQERAEKLAAGKKKAVVEEQNAGPDTDAVEGVQKQEQQKGEAANKPAARRPLRRPSRFDPNPMAEVRGLPPEKQLTWARRRALLDPSAAGTPLLAIESITEAQAANAAASVANKSKEKAQKLNTVDKSRLDWAGYVDKEGIAEELDEYGRAKEGYLGRMDFLDRVDQRREEERRAAKAALKT
ncbi:Craniofacial development protein 1/Bucentaur [Macrophomina phaseolina MS6]|uniref:SWR1-complex protein 5 n=1 Tax=Macrophomina phaseolina (strain MS6) TaxID=1126212 RepID=K2S684_MACPH|nr:Craniofacial development protein 1/Bucentaur [Macrophomina phaseolina MS6]